MKILILNPLWPHPSHSPLAANIVIFELTRELAGQKNVRVGFLKLHRTGNTEPTAPEREGIEALRSHGVDILTPVALPNEPPVRSGWKTLFSPSLADFYPETAHRDAVYRAMTAYTPDVILIPWSEWVTALCSDFSALKFAYYGNPDPKPQRAMARFNHAHHTLGTARYLMRRLKIRHLERIHLAEMAKYEILGNVAANDARYYTEHGHPNSFYIQNLWIDRLGPRWKERRRDGKPHTPIKIIGNIGKLDATANTHGMELLARNVLPELRKALHGRPFEIHILGARDPHPGIKDLLNQPEIRMRGFVDDIDEELLSADVFLCMNNASAYKVCHTRYLHAWSLGCCVVAHADTALSLPEMAHDRNALLGQTPADIARLVAEAAAQPALRKRLGEGGYETFREFFTASRVAPKIIEKIRSYRRPR